VDVTAPMPNISLEFTNPKLIELITVTYTPADGKVGLNWDLAASTPSETLLGPTMRTIASTGPRATTTPIQMIGTNEEDLEPDLVFSQAS